MNAIQSTSYHTKFEGCITNSAHEVDDAHRDSIQPVLVLATMALQNLHYGDQDISRSIMNKMRVSKVINIHLAHVIDSTIVAYKL